MQGVIKVSLLLKNPQATAATIAMFFFFSKAKEAE